MNILFFLLSLLQYPLGIFNLDPKHVPKDTKRVTVLVHGFIHNRSTWHFLQKEFSKNKKLGPVFTLNLGHPLQSIHSYTKTLHEKILEIKKMLGNETTLEVFLIGHSMGGLVCLNYACEYPDERVSKIVTIASPLQGTPTANLAKLWSQSGREMLPNSQFLTNLTEKVKKLEGKTMIYHIGCGRDWFVPCNNAYLEGSCNDKIFSGMGHFAPLYSTSLASQINSWLTGGNKEKQEDKCY